MPTADDPVCGALRPPCHSLPGYFGQNPAASKISGTYAKALHLYSIHLSEIQRIWNPRMITSDQYCKGHSLSGDRGNWGWWGLWRAFLLVPLRCLRWEIRALTWKERDFQDWPISAFVIDMLVARSVLPREAKLRASWAKKHKAWENRVMRSYSRVFQYRTSALANSYLSMFGAVYIILGSFICLWALTDRALTVIQNTSWRGAWMRMTFTAKTISTFITKWGGILSRPPEVVEVQCKGKIGLWLADMHCVSQNGMFFLFQPDSLHCIHQWLKDFASKLLWSILWQELLCLPLEHLFTVTEDSFLCDYKCPPHFVSWPKLQARLSYSKMKPRCPQWTSFHAQYSSKTLLMTFRHSPSISLLPLLFLLILSLASEARWIADSGSRRRWDQKLLTMTMH